MLDPEDFSASSESFPAGTPKPRRSGEIVEERSLAASEASHPTGSGRFLPAGISHQPGDVTRR